MKKVLPMFIFFATLAAVFMTMLSLASCSLEADCNCYRVVNVRYNMITQSGSYQLYNECNSNDNTLHYYKSSSPIKEGTIICNYNKK